MSEIQQFSYHCHTNFSDGHNSLVEMVRRAKAVGFTELGISEHLIVHKNMWQSPSCAVNAYMKAQPHIYNTDFADILEHFQRHCDEMRRVAKAENFKLHTGFEVDFFTYDGWFEQLQDFLHKLDYDYVISGNHFLFDENCESIINLTDLPILCTDTAVCRDYLRRHFQTMEQAVATGCFKFLAHLDYARRLGDDLCGPNDFWPEKLAVLDALASHNVAMEISTKGLRRVNDYYPSGNILDAAAARNICFVISDDAHSLEEVGANFAGAEKALQQHGITRRLHF